MRRLLGVALTALFAASCGPPVFQSPEFDPLPEAPMDSVAAVIFLVGDAGNGTRERSPLVNHLHSAVERATAAAARDTAVVVLFLGDNVYPVGVRSRADPMFQTDSARLAAQMWAVRGPNALARRTAAYFLAGNHDWGNLGGQAGLERLRNQERLLGRWQRFGIRTYLRPGAGHPGPATVDVGGVIRVVMLDTHWWLQSDAEQSLARRRAVLDSVGLALEDARQRDIPTIVASHHPYTSGGPHSGGGGIDPFMLLRKSGTVIQDLNSIPLRNLLRGLSEVFSETERPLAYVGGHDHSLQVLRTARPGAPGWSLVSGAGSKLTHVAPAPGMVWASAQPGYMRLVVRVDGHIDLYVEGVPAEYITCDQETEAAVAECMRDGFAAFHTIYSVRMR